MSSNQVLIGKAVKFAEQILIVSAAGISMLCSINPSSAISAPPGVSSPPATPLSVPTNTPPLPEPQSLPDQLKLTPPQKEKINAIRAEQRKQVQEVLTLEQRTKYAEGIKKNQKVGTVLSSLNLNADQKTKIKAIFQKSAEKSKAVLTLEQAKILEKYIEKNKKTK